MNSCVKRVVSTALTDLEWSNSSLIDADPEAIAALRDSVDGDVLVFGSVTLARWLLEHHLVDELRLLTYPLALGEGLRLFADGVVVPLELTSSTTFASGAIALHYHPLAERPAPVPHLYS
jgi:dihydrofolate reductase